jgi:hypothetical protein
MLIYVLWWRPSWISDQASSLKPLGQLKPNCPGMIIGRSFTKFLLFYADQKSKMATTTGHRLTVDPLGKCSNAFFFAKNVMFVEDHPMNIHVQFGFNHICSFEEEGI